MPDIARHLDVSLRLESDTASLVQIQCNPQVLFCFLNLVGASGLKLG